MSHSCRRFFGHNRNQSISERRHIFTVTELRYFASLFVKESANADSFDRLQEQTHATTIRLLAVENSLHRCGKVDDPASIKYTIATLIPRDAKAQHGDAPR